MITKGERRNRGESGNRTPSTYRARTRTVGYRKVQDRYSKARKGANQWRFYQKTTLTLTALTLSQHKTTALTLSQHKTTTLTNPPPPISQVFLTI